MTTKPGKLIRGNKVTEIINADQSSVGHVLERAGLFWLTIGQNARHSGAGCQTVHQTMTAALKKAGFKVANTITPIDQMSK